MLVISLCPNHNNRMSRELEPVVSEAFKEQPDWIRVADLIRRQDGCAQFPVDQVRQILDNLGEIVLTEPDIGDRWVSMSVLVVDEGRPFSIVLDDDNVVRALRIEARNDYRGGLGRGLIAAREISLSTEESPPTVTTWMGPGISRLDTITLASDRPKPRLHIGTDAVNERFTLLADTPELRPVKDRTLSALFQVALLANDFGVPSPTAPEALTEEHARAHRFYEASANRARAIMDARRALEYLLAQEKLLRGSDRPAIFFDGPLDGPTVDGIETALRGIRLPATDRDVQRSIDIYDKALKVLGALKPTDR